MMLEPLTTLKSVYSSVEGHFEERFRLEETLIAIRLSYTKCSLKLAVGMAPQAAKSTPPQCSNSPCEGRRLVITAIWT